MGSIILKYLHISMEISLNSGADRVGLLLAVRVRLSR